MKTLVIVESPSKAKKIQGYLGAGYTVRASLGHVRDLPASKDDIPERYAGEPWAKLGVDIGNGYRPLYVVPKSKASVVRDLRAAVKTHDRVLLASDDDREGESIAWHLTQALGLKNAQRMVFHEVTRDAIQQAVRQVRPIDTQLVGAQESRRILDRLVGYGVSPLLWNSVGSGLSAGRVQSVALDVLARQEEARMAFVSAPYWRVTATLGAPGFTAQVQAVGKDRLATPKDFQADGTLQPGALLMSADQAQKLVAFLNSRPALVSSVEETPFTSRPPAPFTTSTLQQQASLQLKISPAVTMRLAQSLYEGGFITYMRTDSPALSTEATQAARTAATGLFGQSAVPASPRSYGAKSKSAQEAHEAIRPSGTAFRNPDEVGLSGQEAALYDLIWRRTVASQMLDQTGTRTEATFLVGQVTLTASGRVVLEPGYTRLYQEEGEESQALPPLTVGQHLKVSGAKAEEKQTPAPKRYSEASLVSRLEKLGVGRPSTFASILEVLSRRGYTQVKGRQLTVTWTGLLVAQYLRTQMPEVVDAAFTARMEADLDRIAGGELQRLAYLQDVWGERLQAAVGRAGRAVPVLEVPRVPGARVTVRGGVVTLLIGAQGAPLPASQVPDDLTVQEAARVLSGKGEAPAPRNEEAAERRQRKPAAAKGSRSGGGRSAGSRDATKRPRRT